jgi:hypothetical protein
MEETAKAMRSREIGARSYGDLIFGSAAKRCAGDKEGV